MTIETALKLRQTVFLDCDLHGVMLSGIFPVLLAHAFSIPTAQRARKMQRQLPLFNVGEFPDQEKVWQLLLPALPDLHSVVQDVFKKLQRRRSVDQDECFLRMDEGQIAWWMWSQVHNELKEIEEGHPMVYRRRKQQDYVVIDEQISVVYKKLKRRKDRNGDEYLRASNLTTKQNSAFWSQQSIEEIDDLPRVVFGYELREELTAMRCYLGLPSGSNDSMKWVRRIDADESASWGIAEGEFETVPEPVVGFEIEEEAILNTGFQIS